MNNTRIYLVTEEPLQQQARHRLVEATSGAQAIRHCVKERLTARVATARDTAQMMTSGCPIEHAIESDSSPAIKEKLQAGTNPPVPAQSLT